MALNGPLANRCVEKYRAIPPHVGWVVLGFLVSLICGVIFLVGDEDAPAGCHRVNETTGEHNCRSTNVTGWGCPHRLFSHDPELRHGPHGKTEVVCTNQKSTEAFLVCLAGAVFAAACALQALHVYERKNRSGENTPRVQGVEAPPVPVERDGCLAGVSMRASRARRSLSIWWRRRGQGGTRAELRELLDPAGHFDNPAYDGGGDEEACPAGTAYGT